MLGGGAVVDVNDSDTSGDVFVANVIPPQRSQPNKPPPEQRRMRRADTMNEVAAMSFFQNIQPGKNTLDGTLMRRQRSCENLSDVQTTTPRPESLQMRRDALVPERKQFFENEAEEDGTRNDNVIIVPHMQISLGDLHTYNRAISSGGSVLAELQKATVAAQSFYTDDESKKARQPWILKRLYDWSSRAKSREVFRLVQNAHANPDEEYVDAELKAMLGKQWLDMFPKVELCTPVEKKRLQAVWELFYTELTYLYQQLLIVRNVYKEPVKNCQVEGCLLFLEPDLLFGNLEELCQISYSFCKEIYGLLTASREKGQYAPTSIIVSMFDKAYCINYKATMEYLESIRQQDDRFVEFEKICVQDVRCHRLQLEDLLISPLHRITRLPLLLKEIHKYTKEPRENAQLERIIEQLHECLRSIDDSIQWLHNFERLQQLQTQFVWPPIGELEPRTFIPEFLKPALSRQFCENLLAHPRRKLIHEGVLLGVESQKHADYHAFLFNDMFLLTKTKKVAKPVKLRSPASPFKPDQNMRYVVQKQPVPLDSCVFCDVGPHDTAASGTTLKNAFAIIHLTRFYQVVSIYTLQAANKADKDKWIQKFQESVENYESIQLKDMLNCTPLVPSSTGGVGGLLTPTRRRSSHNVGSQTQHDPAATSATSTAANHAPSAAAGSQTQDTTGLHSPRTPASQPSTMRSSPRGSASSVTWLDPKSAAVTSADTTKTNSVNHNNNNSKWYQKMSGAEKRSTTTKGTIPPTKNAVIITQTTTQTQVGTGKPRGTTRSRSETAPDDVGTPPHTSSSSVTSSSNVTSSSVVTLTSMTSQLSANSSTLSSSTGGLSTSSSDYCISLQKCSDDITL